MTVQGKHVKVEAPSSKRGKHAGMIRRSYDIPQILISALLLAAVAIVPFSFNRLIVSLDTPVMAVPESASLNTFTESSGTLSYGLRDSDGGQNQSMVDAPERIVSSYDGELSQDTVFFKGNTPAVVAPPVTYNQNVPEKLQSKTMAGGCELISLDIVFDSMGLDADIHEVVDKHLKKDGHFATGYSGDPYTQGGGYPAGITEAANSYLEAQNEDATAHDLTGITFEELLAFVNEGYPVLVWTTMNYEDPKFAGAFDDGKEWYSNEHCVVLYNIDEEQNKALISDPLDGKTQVDIARFKELFEACGSMAAVVY